MSSKRQHWRAWFALAFGALPGICMAKGDVDRYLGEAGKKTGIAPQRISAKGATPAATDDTSTVPAEPKAAGTKSAKVKADKSKLIHPRDGK